jgi:Leucine-rich repeat (LRR) protein
LKSIAFIAKLKNLEEIKLNGNHLTDIRMNGFIVKVGLARVELSGNRIRYVEGLEVACPNLKYLDISKN